MRATSVSTSVEIGLRFIGIWPGLSRGTLFWLAYMTSVAIALYFQYAYILDHLDFNNMSSLIDSFSITLEYSLSFLKLVSLWSNRRIFYDILLAMDEDWRCVDHDQFHTMTSNANLSRYCSNVLIGINTISAICNIVIRLTLHSTVFERDLNASSRVLPIKMKFPFDAEASPFFEILAVSQFLHGVSIAALIAMMNSLMVTLVLHVSGQIDILRRELLTICSGSFQRSSIIAAIRLLIIRHQRIITFADNMECLYSDIALMQFLSNTLVICCTGFLIIISVSKAGVTIVFVKSFLFYISVTLEAFIFCFAGEYLSTKSKSISDAVYNSLWYNMTPAECQILLLVILRSQKRLTITVGNIMDLSLEGFTIVMKASASYISVLYAMYDTKSENCNELC